MPSDKGLVRSRILLLLGGLACAAPLHAQQAAGDSATADTLPPPPRAVAAGDVVGTAAAGILFVTPELFGIGPETSPCAPCPRDGLPGFDRWALSRERPGVGAAGTVALVLLGLGAQLDLGLRDGGGPHAVALVESAAWALGVTEMTKALVGRKRPVLYTAEIAGDDLSADQLRSFPSGHAAGAFAVATSWWLSRRALEDGNRGMPGWVGLIVAAGVGVTRVTAGRHFPSDVLGGAALGVASALAVHAVKF